MPLSIIILKDDSLMKVSWGQHRSKLIRNMSLNAFMTMVLNLLEANSKYLRHDHSVAIASTHKHFKLLYAYLFSSLAYRAILGYFTDEISKICLLYIFNFLSYLFRGISLLYLSKIVRLLFINIAYVPSLLLEIKEPEFLTKEDAYFI
jgi:hypothetical protein